MHFIQMEFLLKNKIAILRIKNFQIALYSLQKIAEIYLGLFIRTYIQRLHMLPEFGLRFDTYYILRFRLFFLSGSFR